MKKNQIVLTENGAVASKSFLKKASIYGSDEYYILKGFMEENDGMKVMPREIKKKTDKVSYKNLTYANMVAYMKEQSNASELIEEFERQKRMASIAKNKYRYLVNWFKSTCFNNELEFNSYRETVALVNNVSLETPVIH